MKLINYNNLLYYNSNNILLLYIPNDVVTPLYLKKYFNNIMYNIPIANLYNSYQLIHDECVRRSNGLVMYNNTTYKQYYNSIQYRLNLSSSYNSYKLYIQSVLLSISSSYTNLKLQYTLSVNLLVSKRLQYQNQLNSLFFQEIQNTTYNTFLYTGLLKLYNHQLIDNNYNIISTSSYNTIKNWAYKSSNGSLVAKQNNETQNFYIQSDNTNLQVYSKIDSSTYLYTNLIYNTNTITLIPDIVYNLNLKISSEGLLNPRIIGLVPKSKINTLLQSYNLTNFRGKYFNMYSEIEQSFNNNYNNTVNVFSNNLLIKIDNKNYTYLGYNVGSTIYSYSYENLRQNFPLFYKITRLYNILHNLKLLIPDSILLLLQGCLFNTISKQGLDIKQLSKNNNLYQMSLQADSFLLYYIVFFYYLDYSNKSYILTIENVLFIMTLNNIFDYNMNREGKIWI